MPVRPSDSEIRRMVSELPHPEPPDGFARGVMAEVHAEERRRRLRPWYLAAAAAVVVGSGLVVALVGTPLTPAPAPVVAASDPESAEARREFEALREEVRMLGEQIALMDALRSAGARPAVGDARAVFGRPSSGAAVPRPGPSFVTPVRIGGTDEVPLFLDIESFFDRAAPGALSGSPRVLPASDRGRR